MVSRRKQEQDARKAAKSAARQEGRLGRPTPLSKSAIPGDPEGIFPQLKARAGGILTPNLSTSRISEIEQLERNALAEIAETYELKFGKPYEPIRGRLELGILPGSRADYYAKELDELIGLPDVLQEFGAPGMTKPLVRRGGDGSVLRRDRPFGSYQIAPEELANPTANSVRYRRMNLQYEARPLGPLEDINDMYRSPLTRYTQAHETKVAEQFKKYQETGQMPFSTEGDYLVLDLETSGLTAGKEDITQLGYRVAGRETGAEIAGQDKLFHFASPRSRTGTIGETHTVESYFQAKIQEGMAEGETLRIAKNSEGLMSLLEDAEQHGYRIAGQNIEFDISHLLYGYADWRKTLVGDPKNTELIKRIDTMTAALRSGDSIVDMKEMAMMALDNISVHPMLAAQGKYTKFALSNIMLSTDVLEKIAAEEGDAAVSEALSRLHTAGHDTWLELRVMQHKLGDLSKPLDLERRSNWANLIAHTSALTPRTYMTEDMLDPAVRSVIEGFNLIGKNGEVELTPFEHMILQTRRILGGAVTNDPTQVKDVPSFSEAMVGSSYRRQAMEYQEQLANMGVAFPGLDPLTERHLSTTLSRLTHEDLVGTSAGFHYHHADTYGIARWMRQKEANVIHTKAGTAIPQMPVELLEQILGKDHASLQSFMMSPFRTRDTGTPAVALQYRFGEGEAGANDLHAVLSFLSDRERFGPHMTAEMAEKLHGAIRGQGITGGIQVALMKNIRSGGRVNERAVNLLERMQGGMSDFSGGRTNFKAVRVAPKAGMDDDFLYTGAVYADKAASPELVGSLFDQTQAAYDAAAVAAEHASDLDVVHSHATSAPSMAERVWGGEAEDIAAAVSAPNKRYIAERTKNIYEKAMHTNPFRRGQRTNAPVGFMAIAGITAAALVGRKAYKRYNEWNQASEPFREQPYENKDWYYRQRQELDDMTRPGNMPRVDYLSTANVVRDLDSNKINSYKMGPQKNSGLFGGVL